jgi:hypothetical protein
MQRANNAYRASKTARNVNHDILISALHKGIRRSNFDLLNGVSADALTYLSAPTAKKDNPTIVSFYRRLAIATLEDAPMVPEVFILVSKIMNIFKRMHISSFKPDDDKMYCYTKETIKVANLLDSYNRTIVLCPKTRACSGIRLIYRTACNMPPKGSAQYCLFKSRYPDLYRSMKRFSKRRGPIDWDEDDEIIVYCQYMDSWTKEDNMKVDKRNIVKDILKRVKNDELSVAVFQIFEDLYFTQNDFMCGLVPLLWLFGHCKDNVSIVPPASKKTLEKWESMETYEIPPYVTGLRVLGSNKLSGNKLSRPVRGECASGAKIDTTSDDFCIKLMGFYEETRVIEEIQNEMSKSGLTVMHRSYIRSDVPEKTAKAVMNAYSESSKHNNADVSLF